MMEKRGGGGRAVKRRRGGSRRRGAPVVRLQAQKNGGRRDPRLKPAGTGWRSLSRKIYLGSWILATKRHTQSDLGRKGYEHSPSLCELARSRRVTRLVHGETGSGGGYDRARCGLRVHLTSPSPSCAPRWRWAGMAVVLAPPVSGQLVAGTSHGEAVGGKE